MRVQQSTAQGVVYLASEAGVAHLAQSGFQTAVSFPVNRRSTAFLMATEKDESGRFIVTALSTDGGGIPRNFLLSHGLSLVRFDALTLSEFVQKCAWMPARMLGLPGKGHLGPGADGDLVVVDPEAHQALLTVAGGKVIMAHGVVIGSGGTLITTERGVEALEDQNVPVEVADLPGSLLYTAS
jgi:imidazolonepropionase-like amidohydrolase